MDSVFIKLVSGTRISNHLGLRMDPGMEYRYGKNYLYVDVPVRVTDEYKDIKRNQHIYVEASASINVKGRSIVEVEPNPALAEYGQVQASYKVHPESGEKQVGFWFTAHKGVDLTQLDYCARIYMYA